MYLCGFPYKNVGLSHCQQKKKKKKKAAEEGKSFLTC